MFQSLLLASTNCFDYFVLINSFLLLGWWSFFGKRQNLYQGWQSHFCFLWSKAEAASRNRNGVDALNLPAAKAIQIFGNADHRVLNMFYQVSDDLGTSVSFYSERAYQPLAFNIGGRNREGESIAKALPNPASHDDVLCFYAFCFANELQSKKNLALPTNYKD